MLSVNPTLKPDDIRKILKSTVKKPGIWGSGIGSGIVNAGMAVQTAKYREAINSECSVKIKSATALSGQKAKIVIAELIYKDSGLQSGKTYYYQVKAYIKYGGTYKLVQTSNLISVKAKTK